MLVVVAFLCPFMVVFVRMKKVKSVFFRFALCAFVILMATAVLSLPPGSKAPPFTAEGAQAWINSEPITWDDLRGNVVLLDFWTFECWNCYLSFPWLNDLEQRYAKDGLHVIGIHTPEFEHEKDVVRVKDKVKEFGLRHPVMLDNDFRYWRALNNRYWPAFYLVDKDGRIQATYVGETHKSSDQAKRIEKEVQRLLAQEG